MISIEEAKNIINSNIPDTDIIEKDIVEAAGFTIAEDVIANVNLPGFTNSAMDGFAVKWDEIKDNSANPVKLRIIGESAAGIPFKNAGKDGSAVRINTGALMPGEYDTVVPVENIEVHDNCITIKSIKKKNQNVRFAGEEFKNGDTILNKYSELNPPELALLASAGVSKVKVFDKFKVSIIVTGSELVADNSELEESQIRESNGLMLTTLFREAGAAVQPIIRIGDSLSETKKAIKDAESESDIIVMSGGVSVGPHDHVKEASKENGFEELFWKVNQKPGKPLYFSRKNNKILFGVPGNPVSALICALFYIYPVIRYNKNRTSNKNYINAFSENEIVNKQDRAHFMRAKIIYNSQNNRSIEILHKQASHMLSTLTEADGFVLLEPNQIIKPNNELKFYAFPWRNKWGI